MKRRAINQRAVRPGRPTETEHREILREALPSGKGWRSLKELLLAMPEAGEDADFERSPDRASVIQPSW